MSQKALVYLLLADGFEEVEALTPVDMLKRAGIDVKMVSITENRVVCGSHGISVLADMVASEAQETPSMLVLPGGMPGAKNLDASPFTDKVLARMQGQGRLAAICAAPLVFGHRGLLNGVKATCFRGFEQELEGAIFLEDRVVTDGRFTTSRGMGTAVDFGAELVRLLTDDATAKAMLEAVYAV